MVLRPWPLWTFRLRILDCERNPHSVLYWLRLVSVDRTFGPTQQGSRDKTLQDRDNLHGHHFGGSRTRLRDQDRQSLPVQISDNPDLQKLPQVLWVSDGYPVQGSLCHHRRKAISDRRWGLPPPHDRLEVEVPQDGVKSQRNTTSCAIGQENPLLA